MTCAGGTDLQFVKLVHNCHYLIFFHQNLHSNGELMGEFTSKI